MSRFDTSLIKVMQCLFLLWNQAINCALARTISIAFFIHFLTFCQAFIGVCFPILATDWPQVPEAGLSRMQEQKRL